jgi:hypothetical protein
MQLQPTLASASALNWTKINILKGLKSLTRNLPLSISPLPFHGE